MTHIPINCPFCHKIDPVIENNYAYGTFDHYPVNKGHMLIITKRHIANYFETTEDEKHAILELLENAKKVIDSKYKPDGYNIGINIGTAAGQTIMHLHVHLIPRYLGDIDGDPRGGVRGVIPQKRMY